MDIPCVCGHLKKIHIKLKHRFEWECEDCMDKWFHMIHPKTTDFYCTKYRPDNLTYVEQLAKEKNLL
jgi:hypothetical protein